MNWFYYSKADNITGTAQLDFLVHQTSTLVLSLQLEETLLEMYQFGLDDDQVIFGDGKI